MFPGKPSSQNLVYDAMEAFGTPEGPEKLRLAAEADPDHPDVLLLIAATAVDEEDARDYTSRAVASAASRLGPNYEKEYKGVFWSDTDTRPYMRALEQAAELEVVTGNLKDAVPLYERLLRSFGFRPR